MKTSDKALALCHAIEAAGASEALTKCSVLATELHTEAKRLSELADKMKRFAAENYPPDDKGQVDFVRVLLEGYAAELLEPDEPNAEVSDGGPLTHKSPAAQSRRSLH